MSGAFVVPFCNRGTLKREYRNTNINNKNNVRDGGYGLYFATINTSYEDRVEGIKASVENNPSFYKAGVNVLYIISTTSDDRGMAIMIKKSDARCAFQYFDYWGKNEFWTLTGSGWVKH